MKKIGYIRVSTPEQRHDRQMAGLVGICDELHVETLSACSAKRPAYDRVIRSLKAGDMLVVWDLDRAFRSVVDALTEAEKLRARGVHFQIANLSIDTTTPAGIFVYTILSALAEFERRMLSQRTKEGLAAARERGKRIGRPPTMSADEVRDARARIAVGQKGRSAHYAYYLCDTKGCVAYRKSVRREVIEGEFENLLRSLKPSEGLFNLAFAMFRDLWDARLAGARSQGATLEKDVRAIERKIEQLLDRIVEAEGASLIAAYEKRIRDLETEKALMREKIASCGKPLASFGETYRTAFDFLANPCKLWHSPRLEDRRAVLKLVFAERLPYVRNEGYRTAKISMPFKLLGSMETDEKLMVPRGGMRSLVEIKAYQYRGVTGADHRAVAFCGLAWA